MPNAFGAVGPTYPVKQPFQPGSNTGTIGNQSPPWAPTPTVPSAFKGGMQSPPTSSTKPLPTQRPVRPITGGGLRSPGTGGVRRPPVAPPPAPGPNLTRPGQAGFVPLWFQRAHAGDVMDPSGFAPLWAARTSRLAAGAGTQSPNEMENPTSATKPLPTPPAFGGPTNASTGAAPPPGAVAPPGTTWVPGLGFVGTPAPGQAPSPAFQGFGWNSLNGNQGGGPGAPQGLPALDANGLPQYASQAQGVQTAWDMAGGANRGQLRKNPQTGAMEILMGSGQGGESYSWQPYDQGNLGQRQNAELFQRYGPNWTSGSGATSMHSGDIAQILTESLGRQPTQQEVYDQYYGVGPRVQGIAYNSNRGYAASGAPLAFGGGG